MIAECEGCGELRGDELLDAGDVVETLERLGWVEAWTGWYCSDCARERLG